MSTRSVMLTVSLEIDEVAYQRHLTQIDDDIDETPRIARLLDQAARAASLAAIDYLRHVGVDPILLGDWTYSVAPMPEVGDDVF